MVDQIEMTPQQVRDSVYTALRVSIDALPQLKGKGKVLNPSVVDAAVGRLADAIVQRFATAQITLHHPPRPMNGTNGPWGR